MDEEANSAIQAAQKVEEVVTQTVAEATEVVTLIMQKNDSGNLFDVPIGEMGIIFITLLLMYVLIFHKFFSRVFLRTSGNKASYRDVIISQVIIYISLIIMSYGIALFFTVSIEFLTRVSFAIFVWICVKYVSIFLDKHFVPWSKKYFGERAIAHNMLKDIAKRLLIVFALFFTFIFLKIGIVKFFSMDIPGYVGVFVLLPLLMQMNLLSFFSVISKGFIIGDFIQVGTSSDAIAGTCVAVKFSGTEIIMPNGEKVILKLDKFANADVINLSTKDSHRSTRKYYIDISMSSDNLRFCQQSVKEAVNSTQYCKMVQCSYGDSIYHHVLCVIFDVKVKNISTARSIMDEVHFDIIAKCDNKFAVSHFCTVME